MEVRNNPQDLQDIVIVCVDCGEEFIFSSGEQAYFNSKFLSQPKRCHACRKKRRLTLVPEVQQHDL